MVPFLFGDQVFHALSGGALWWETRRALLIADLHLEKASAYARRGQMLPPYDSDEGLQALELLVHQHRPAELWCLGDGWHDADGPARLPLSAQLRLGQLCGQTRLLWVLGNHDARVIGLPGEVMTEAETYGIVLRHEAKAAETRPEISGHYHPKLRLTLRGRAVARRCFVLGRNKLILPAFGPLTGGLSADDPCILSAVGAPASALVTAAGRLLAFPLSA